MLSARKRLYPKLEREGGVNTPILMKDACNRLFRFSRSIVSLFNNRGCGNNEDGDGVDGVYILFTLYLNCQFFFYKQ